MPLSIREQNDFKAAGLAGAEPFRFSLISGRPSERKVDPAPVESVLNQNLKLETYGDIKSIDFLLEAGAGWEGDEYIRYNPDSRGIEICLHADFPPAGTPVSSNEVHASVARSFLAAVPLFAETPVPGFEVDEFYRDAEALFRQRGWLGSPATLDRSGIYLVWGTDYRSGLPPELPAQFFVRKTARREWFDLIDDDAFAARLNQGIDLDAYGPGVCEIYLTLLADEPSGRKTGFHSAFFPHDREWHLSLPLGLPPYPVSAMTAAFLAALDRGDVAKPEEVDWEGVGMGIRKLMGPG